MRWQRRCYQLLDLEQTWFGFAAVCSTQKKPPWLSRSTYAFLKVYDHCDYLNPD